MNLKLKRTPGIYVVGFMGAGKTHRRPPSGPSSGLELLRYRRRNRGRREDHHRRDFRDARRSRSSAASKPTSSRQHVRWIERGRPAVLALGGGAFAEPANRDLLENNGITVWLDCPFETVQRRVAQATHRPLARDPETIRRALRIAPRGLPLRRRAHSHRHATIPRRPWTPSWRIRCSNELPSAPAPPGARHLPRRARGRRSRGRRRRGTSRARRISRGTATST